MSEEFADLAPHWPGLLKFFVTVAKERFRGLRCVGISTEGDIHAGVEGLDGKTKHYVWLKGNTWNDKGNYWNEQRDDIVYLATVKPEHWEYWAVDEQGERWEIK